MLVYSLRAIANVIAVVMFYNTYPFIFLDHFLCADVAAFVRISAEQISEYTC